MSKKLFALFVFCLTITQIFGRCLDYEVMKPCQCYNNNNLTGPWIGCSYEVDKNADLGEVFERMSKKLSQNEKHFKELFLSDTGITELKENTFKDITFGKITISENKELTKIHENAFNGTDKVTSELWIRDNPKLSSLSLYKTITKFTNVTQVHLSNDNLTDIPENAFQNDQGHNSTLKYLYLDGQTITKIGSKAFEDYRNLLGVWLWNTSITYFPDNAFAIKNHSVINNTEYKHNYLIIDLRNNRLLSSTSFSNRSLDNINVPVDLRFGSSPLLTYLDEKIFKPFLDQNDKNTIWFDVYVKNTLDCQDCRNVWIKDWIIRKNETGLVKRVSEYICSSKFSSLNSIKNTDNFKNC